MSDELNTARTAVQVQLEAAAQTLIDKADLAAVQAKLTDIRVSADAFNKLLYAKASLCGDTATDVFLRIKEDIDRVNALGDSLATCVSTLRHEAETMTSCPPGT